MTNNLEFLTVIGIMQSRSGTFFVVDSQFHLSFSLKNCQLTIQLVKQFFIPQTLRW